MTDESLKDAYKNQYKTRHKQISRQLVKKMPANLLKFLVVEVAGRGSIIPRSPFSPTERNAIMQQKIMFCFQNMPEPPASAQRLTPQLLSL